MKYEMNIQIIKDYLYLNDFQINIITYNIKIKF